jgi:phage terminase large subunit-like protein
MVEETIRSVDRNVPLKTVTASRGKAVRAEPVSALV